MNKQIVLGWGLITAAFFGGATFASAAESIGGAEIVVNEVKGNLTAGKVVTVLRGDDVYRDEGVKTEADSTAKLVLRDKTILTVGPSSTVKLDRFVYAGEGSTGAIAVNLIRGALRFSTGNAAKNSYLITTPTAALGVRGTIFTIEATRAKTLVTLNEGEMNVCMRAFRQRCVVLDHPGQQATVTATQVATIADPTSPSVGGILGAIFGAVRGTPAAHAAPAAPAAPVLQVLVPVDRAMVKVMEMGTASAREETTGMATTVTGMAMGTGTALATAAEMDTEIA